MLGRGYDHDKVEYRGEYFRRRHGNNVFEASEKAKRASSDFVDKRFVFSAIGRSSRAAVHSRSVQSALEYDIHKNMTASTAVFRLTGGFDCGSQSGFSFNQY